MGGSFREFRLGDAHGGGIVGATDHAEGERHAVHGVAPDERDPGARGQPDDAGRLRERRLEDVPVPQVRESEGLRAFREQTQQADWFGELGEDPGGGGGDPGAEDHAETAAALDRILGFIAAGRAA